MRNQPTGWVKVNATTWRLDLEENHVQVSQFSEGWRVYVNDRRTCLNTTPIQSKKEAMEAAKNALINL
jgi:hypothetical protein